MNVDAPPIVSYPLRRYLLEEARGKRREYKAYWYGVKFTDAMVSGVDQVRIVEVDTDAPFLWTGTIGRDQQGNTGWLNALLQVRVGGAGGKAWARTPVHWVNAVGVRPVPAMLPAPWLVAAGSQFHVTFTPIQAPQSNPPVWLLFEGLKVYGWGP